MAALNVVQRLRHTSDMRAYRRRISLELHHDMLLRALPALIDVPLPLFGADGTLRDVDQLLELPNYLLLLGESGSGRQLLLQQIAQRWLRQEDAPTPVLLSLPRIDDGRSAPLSLISEALNQPNLVGRTAARRVGAANEPLAERLAGWALLLSGLDELSENRVAAWRAALQLAPQHLPDSRVIVAAATAEPRWPNFTTIQLESPNPELLEEWFVALVPSDRRATLLEASQHNGPLAPLTERFFECALLALCAERNSVPANRAALYDNALAMLYQIDGEAGRSTRSQLQLLAAYDERPEQLVAGLLEPTGVGTLRFAHPLLRTFLAARQITEEARFDLLATLDSEARRELVRFCTTLISDIDPLYSQLWAEGRPDPDDVVTLGMCLRERSDVPMLWRLRILSALAIIARDSQAKHHSQAEALIRTNRLALDRTFATLVETEGTAQRMIPQLLRLLPAELALSYLERLACEPRIPPPLAWDVADLLIDRTPANAAPLPAPQNSTARARWAYVQSLRGPEHRHALANSIGADGVMVLAESGLDDMRLLRVAAVLIDDPHLPTAVRTAAIHLLSHSSQPTALTVIERACYDADAFVRKTALAALATRDANRGQTALSRAALDQEAPNDTRIGAIERLATRFADESQLLLTRCARDNSLPLYARLLSSAASIGGPASTLADLSRDSQNHIDVRALAAAGLAQSDEPAADELLLKLIEDPTTPTEVLIALSEHLIRPNPAIAQALVVLLAQNSSDIELTLAIICGLTTTKSEQAIETLGELVSGARERLLHAVPVHLHTASSADALADYQLPPALAARLNMVLDRAASEAEQPTTLNEFLTDQADIIRRASAEALAAIGGNGARAVLMAALLDDSCGNAGEAVVQALARTGSGSVEALNHVLQNNDINPMLRWLVVQELRSHPEGQQPLQQLLGDDQADIFIRGAVAEALGQRGAITALPLLRHLADDANNETHLRSQAILGLGLLDEPATEVALIRLLGDANDDPALRGMAAEHLPSNLSAEGMRLLRETIRRDRQPELVIAGIVHAIGKHRDHEALPLLLRFAQDERGVVARAALVALGELGDGSVAPVLVRVTQNPAAERATRLAAIGVLLKIGGDGYRPLLRTYIDEGALPFRLQALEYLLEHADAHSIGELLARQELPFPMRLSLLHACKAHASTGDRLTALFADPSEPLLLRVRAIEIVRDLACRAAEPALIALAADGPAALRIACIDALGTFAGSTACTTLGNLAEGSSQSATIRAAARMNLRAAAMRTIAPRLSQMRSNNDPEQL